MSQSERGSHWPWSWSVSPAWPLCGPAWALLSLPSLQPPVDRSTDESLNQADKGPERRGALIPNIRSENLNENSSSVCTLTRRNACNCLGCSTSPTDKWRSGFRTVAWRRRNWTEIDYNIIRLTLCFRGQSSTAPCCGALWRLHTHTDWFSGCDSPAVHCVPQWPRQQQQQRQCSVVNFKFEDNSSLWSEKNPKTEHELRQSVDYDFALQTLCFGGM